MSLNRKIEKLQESQTELENTLLVRQAKTEAEVRQLKMNVLAAVSEDIEEVFAPPTKKIVKEPMPEIKNTSNPIYEGG